MDVRTYKGKKAHTPSRDARITDQAPEYVQSRLIKRPRLGYYEYEHLALERANVEIGVEKMAARENASDTEKVTSSGEKMAGKKNATGQKEGDAEKVTSSVGKEDGVENVTDTKIESDVESETDLGDIENVSVEQILYDIDQIIGNEDGPGVVNTTD